MLTAIRVVRASEFQNHRPKAKVRTIKSNREHSGRSCEQRWEHQLSNVDGGEHTASGYDKVTSCHDPCHSSPPSYCV